MKKRITNKVFCVAIIPAILLLVQSVAAVFGFALDFADLQAKLLEVVESVFMILVILGIVVDPSTSGIKDAESEEITEETFDELQNGKEMGEDDE